MYDILGTTSTGPYYVNFSTGSSGQQQQYASTGLIFNTVNNALSCSAFSASAYYGYTRTGFNVKAFGAAGDSTTDDTVAIQKAISASLTAGVSNRGIELFFPAGVYRTSSPISMSGNNVTLVGAGVGSVALYPQHTTGDVLQIGNGGTTSTDFCGLMNMQIICASSRTSGATININSANDVLIQNFGISNYYTGINITGSSIKVRIDTGTLTSGQSGSGEAINILNGAAGDTYISNLVTSNTPSSKPFAGIQIQQTGHTSIHRVNFTSADNGLYINPQSSQLVNYLFCEHSLFDSCGTHAVYFNPNGAGAMIRSCVFDNSWFSGNGFGVWCVYWFSGNGTNHR